ncbi:hypothetical protein KSP40_PGU006593 [Platanthera guangdongensis]|uniref:Uncharacterized protein n=1 Tax=Platanthera guangdongensis TaxID=2320717 RepID=A0ABR2LSG1_9ASPA
MSIIKVHIVAMEVWRKNDAGDPFKILEVKCSRTIKALAYWPKFNAKKAQNPGGTRIIPPGFRAF